jgi:hypothetical protein
MPTMSASLIQIRDGYLAALATDAEFPQADYSLDGETVNRAAWRKGLMDEVLRLNKLINSVNPYIVSTRCVT